jgi:Fe-S-cluster containining protein
MPAPEDTPDSDSTPASDAAALVTPLTIGGHAVPGVWRFLFPEPIEESSLPRECGSSCGNCPKVVEEGFHPDFRCCTYHPRIPNFLVGLALEDAATAPLVTEAIAAGFATPEGLIPTTAQTRAALAQRAAGRFGQTADVVCRFLDVEKRECRMYRYRNAVCSTYFCTHDHGDAGQDFWSALQTAASQVEASLAQWTMAKVGLDVAAYFQRFEALAATVATHSDTPTRAWTTETLDQLWGPWRGKEREFFLKCAALVRANKERLNEIAASVTLRSTPEYDRAARAQLTPEQRRELDLTDEGDQGEPASTSDLWYLFQVAHRNLWRLPDADAPIAVGKGVTLAPNPQATPFERYHHAKPWVATVEGAKHYLDADAYALIQEFQTPRAATNDWLAGLRDGDARARLSELLAKKILTTEG